MSAKPKSRFLYFAVVLIAGIIVSHFMTERARASDGDTQSTDATSELAQQELLDRFSNAELTSHGYGYDRTRYGWGGRRYYGGGWLSSRYGNFGFGGASYGSGYYSFGHLPYGNYGYHSPYSGLGYTGYQSLGYSAYSGLGYRPYGSFYRPWSNRYAVGRYAWSYSPGSPGYHGIDYARYRFAPISLTFGYSDYSNANAYDGAYRDQPTYLPGRGFTGGYYVPVTTCCSHSTAYYRGDFGFCSAPGDCKCDDDVYEDIIDDVEDAVEDAVDNLDD